MDLQLLMLALIGLAGFLITYTIFKLIFHNRLSVAKRIEEINERPRYTEEDPYSLPFRERIMKPLLKKFERTAMSLTPGSLVEKEKELLVLAGNPNHLTVGEWITLRMLFWLGIGGFLTFFATFQESILKGMVIALVGWVLGYIAPVFYLKRKREDRKSNIQRGLPDVLDILTVSVEAGLGFDAALSKVVEKTNGTLTEEFSKTMQEMKMGKSRKDALRDLGKRTGVDDMLQFVNAIIQADQLGVRIGNVLRVQSEDIRQKRKQRAEEKAMKAPIKILFPLLMFIFPAIFIIILGPAVISIMNSFLGG